MFNTITYTLEDHAQGYVPEAQQPVVCDECERMMHGHSRNWKHLHAIRNSADHFTVIDFKGAGTEECRCCHTRELSGRHLVQVTRKQKAA
jgi:hypothetical protein